MSIIVSSHNKLYPEIYNSAEAEISGLRSMSAWSYLGRKLKDGAVPAGIVSQKEEKSKGLAVHPVVRDLGNDTHLIATRYYEVYGEDQTEPKEGRGKKTTSTQHQPQPLHSISFVQEQERRTDLNRLSDKVVTTQIIMEKPRAGRPRVNSGSWAYCPALRQDHETALGRDIELAKCVLHTLYLFRFIGDNKKGKGDWIELGSKYCERLCGWDNWKRVRDKLLGLGVVEQTKIETTEDEYGLGIEHTDVRGQKGKSAYAYRLGADYRDAKHTRHDLTHPATINMLERHKGRKLEPVHKFIERNLLKLTVEPVPEERLLELARQDGDDGTVGAKVEAYRESLRWIAEKSFFIRVDDFAHRVHTNITGLKSELRSYLRVNGQPLCQIDIKCAQPLLIGLLARKAGYRDDRYLKLCENDLYQWIADQMSLTRKEVKEKLTQRGLFSHNRSRHQASDVMKFFKREFPSIYEYMTEIKGQPKSKDNPKPHNRLAMLAQSAEVDLVVHRVVDRIRKERPDMFLTTIHDSIVMLRADADYVKMTMLDEFRKLDLNPTLEIDDYGEEHHHHEQDDQAPDTGRGTCPRPDVPHQPHRVQQVPGRSAGVRLRPGRPRRHVDVRVARE
jgi:hypothetical protein